MRSLNIGIFHDEEIGKLMGKKGTESDILFFNRKTDDCIFTFMQPVDDKLQAKAQIMSRIDAAILFASNITPAFGETILLLDSFGIKKGIVMIPPFSDIRPITELIKGTSLESFLVKDRDPTAVFEKLREMQPERDTKSPTSIVIDHSFNVKGVGQIVLGFVESGTLKKHDKLKLVPAGKEVIIRSIQMHDKDFDEAAAGSRVGLAIKGASVDEMRRGSVICSEGVYETSKDFELRFEPNRFYPDGLREGNFHVSVGMQTVTATVKRIDEKVVSFSTERPIVHRRDDDFLLLDLNAAKVHLMGKGKSAV